MNSDGVLNIVKKKIRLFSIILFCTYCGQLFTKIPAKIFYTKENNFEHFCFGNFKIVSGLAELFFICYKINPESSVYIK